MCEWKAFHLIHFPYIFLSTKGIKLLPESDLQLPSASFDFCTSLEQFSKLCRVSPDLQIPLLIINPHNSTYQVRNTSITGSAKQMGKPRHRAERGQPHQPGCDTCSSDHLVKVRWCRRSRIDLGRPVYRSGTAGHLLTAKLTWRWGGHTPELK